MRVSASLFVALCAAALAGRADQSPGGAPAPTPAAAAATRPELKPWGFKVFVK